MKPLTTPIAILAPATAAWKLLIDNQRWAEWNPSVARFDCANRCIALGSVGRVQTVFDLWFSFLQITISTACQFWYWKVVGIPATGHRVQSIPPNLCRVVFEVPVLTAPYLVVCKLAAP